MRMMSGMANASARGRTVTSMARSAAISALQAASIALLEALRNLGEVEVHPRRARLHVAAGDEGADVAEDDAREEVQPRVGAHEQRAPGVVEGAADLRARRRDRVALGEDEPLLAVLLAGADDP